MRWKISMKNDKYEDYVAMSLKYHVIKKKEHLVMDTSTAIKSKKMYIKIS